MRPACREARQRRNHDAFHPLFLAQSVHHLSLQPKVPVKTLADFNLRSRYCETIFVLPTAAATASFTSDSLRPWSVITS